MKYGGTFEQTQEADKQHRHFQHKIEAIARCIMPDILAFYESEEGQREFAEWKKRREAEKQGDKTE